MVGTLAVVAVETYRVEALMAELRRMGAQAFHFRSFVPGRVLVSGRFADDAIARDVVAGLRQRGWAAAQRADDDDPYLFAWRHRTEPILVADGQLVVCLPWAEFDRGTSAVVEIDPGAAFGGGTHPTTRLLLEALAGRISGGEHVLDVGCGSGVLAIAAVRLGAAAALGVDIEPTAVEATQANAARNELADRVSVCSTPLADLAGPFDIVVANIGQSVLIELAADIQRVLAPGGWLGLSGLSPSQVSRVGAAYPALQTVEVPQLQDWVAILAERKSS